MRSVCASCGRPATQTGDVMSYVQGCASVRVGDVAEHFGITVYQASKALCRLADMGMIARLKRGVYTADRELARRVLSAKFESLMATL